MQCIIMENTLIKLLHHDETKKRAHDSQIVRAKENLKLSHVGSSYMFCLIHLSVNRRLQSFKYFYDSNCVLDVFYE